MEFMNLPGFSESSGELGAIGIIPVLVPGHILQHLWMLVYIAGTTGINRFSHGYDWQLKHNAAFYGNRIR